MKYYYERPAVVYGKLQRLNGFKISTYTDHPLYLRATLLERDKTKLLVVRQRFDLDTKSLYFDRIDDNLIDDIIHQKGILDIYYELCSWPNPVDYIPVINVRSLMWKLRMRPLKKEWWETSFKKHLL